MRCGQDLELRCYPRDDRGFLEATQRAVSESRESIRDARLLLAAVEAQLRMSYPRVRIQARQRLAERGDHEPELWYCYRDGGFAA
jgi:hypothetical protein